MFKLYSPSEGKVNLFKGMWGAEDNALIYIMDEVSELVTLMHAVKKELLLKASIVQ